VKPNRCLVAAPQFDCKDPRFSFYSDHLLVCLCVAALVVDRIPWPPQQCPSASVYVFLCLENIFDLTFI
jgi:hypothetical protein